MKGIQKKNNITLFPKLKRNVTPVKKTAASKKSSPTAALLPKSDSRPKLKKHRDQIVAIQEEKEEEEEEIDWTKPEPLYLTPVSEEERNRSWPYTIVTDNSELTPVSPSTLLSFRWSKLMDYDDLVHFQTWLDSENEKDEAVSL